MWKIVQGYEWLEVTREGLCRSSRSGKYYKPHTDKDGYLKITTRVNGKNVRCFLHRAVAIAFIANPDNLPVVNHLDNNPQNSHADNLEWTTHKGNTAHMYAQGRQGKPPTGENSNLNKYSSELIHELCSLISKGESNAQISRLLGVHRTLPSDIRNKKSWREISDLYF